MFKTIDNLPVVFVFDFLNFLFKEYWTWYFLVPAAFFHVTLTDFFFVTFALFILTFAIVLAVVIPDSFAAVVATVWVVGSSFLGAAVVGATILPATFFSVVNSGAFVVG